MTVDEALIVWAAIQANVTPDRVANVRFKESNWTCWADTCEIDGVLVEFTVDGTAWTSEREWIDAAEFVREVSRVAATAAAAST